MKGTVSASGVPFGRIIYTWETYDLFFPKRFPFTLPQPHYHHLSYVMFQRSCGYVLDERNTSSGQMTDQISVSWFEDLSSLHQVSRTSSSSFQKDIRRVTHLYWNSSFFFLTTPRRLSVHAATSAAFYPCHYEIRSNKEGQVHTHCNTINL